MTRLDPGALVLMCFNGDMTLFVHTGAYAGDDHRCRGYAEVLWLDVECDDGGVDTVDGVVRRGVLDLSTVNGDMALWWLLC